MCNYIFVVYISLVIVCNVVNLKADILEDTINSTNAGKLTFVYKQMLNTFPRHLHLYHFENKTLSDLESILHISRPTEDPTVLFNYDLEGAFHRPLEHACINIILLQNTSKFNEFYYTPFNVNPMDIVFIVLYSPYSLYEYWDSVRFILVFSQRNNTLHVIRYYYDQKVISVEVPNANTDLLTAEKHDKIFHRLFTMDIAFKKCPPFIYLEHQDVLDGIEFQILQVVMAKLNLHYRLLDYSNATVRKALDDLSNRKVHLVVGCLSNTVHRNQLVSFTPAFFHEHYTVIYSSNGFEDNSLLLMFRPFHLVVWLLLSLLIGIIGLMLFKMHTSLNDGPHGGILVYLNMPFQSILEQPFRMQFQRLSMRVLIISWLITALIFSNAYKSKLASSMIHPGFKEPDSIQDMLDHNFDYYLSNIDFVFLGDIMTTSFNATFQKVVARRHEFNNICDSISNLTSIRYGIIGEETVLKYSAWYTCHGIITQKEISSIRVTKRPLINNGHSWALKKNSPFITRIENTLEELKSYGIILKWYKSFKISRMLTKSNSPNSHQERELFIPKAPFFLLGLGTFLAFLFFTFEVAYCKWRRSSF